MNKFIILTLIISIIVPGFSQNCPQYTCSSSGNSMTAFSTSSLFPTCLTQGTTTNSNAQAISACSQGFTCYLLNLGSSIYWQSPAGTNGQPAPQGAGIYSAPSNPSSSNAACYLGNCQALQPKGGACYRNQDCASQNCTSGTCSVVGVGAICTNYPYVCDVGLGCGIQYDSNGKILNTNGDSFCFSYLQIGQQCFYNSQCTYGSFCSGTSTTGSAPATFQCMAIFSVASNSLSQSNPPKIYNSQSIGSYPPQWTMCVNGFYDSKQGCVTITSPTNFGPQQPCTFYSQCQTDIATLGVTLPGGYNYMTSTLSTSATWFTSPGTVFGQCACGALTTTGTAFCTGYPGDSAWSTQFAAVNKEATTNSQNIKQYATWMSNYQCTTTPLYRPIPQTPTMYPVPNNNAYYYLIQTAQPSSANTWFIQFGKNDTGLGCLSQFPNINGIGDQILPIVTPGAGSTNKLQCPIYQCQSQSSQTSTQCLNVNTPVMGNMSTNSSGFQFNYTAQATVWLYSCLQNYVCYSNTTTSYSQCTACGWQKGSTSSLNTLSYNNFNNTPFTCQLSTPYVDNGQNCYISRQGDCVTKQCGAPSASGVVSSCQTLSLTASCFTSYQCPVNSVCDYNQTCSTVYSVGQYCASNSYTNCPPNTMCAQQNGKGTYSCQKYFTIPVNVSLSVITAAGTITSSTAASTQQQYMSPMCQSASYNASTNQCNPTMESTPGGWPKNCTANSQCTGIWGTQQNCICQPNTQGWMYCGGFWSDWMNTWPFLRNQYNQAVSWAQTNWNTGCYFYNSMAWYSSNGCNRVPLNGGFSYLNGANLQIGLYINNGILGVVPQQYVPSCYNTLIWGYNITDPKQLFASGFVINIALILLMLAVLFI